MAMRHEFERREGPQGGIELAQERRLARDGHLRAPRQRLAQQPTGIAQLVGRVEVEV